MENNENIKFNEFVDFLSSNIDTVIKKDIFQSNEYKQKVYAISSFIEFLKAGASVRVLPIENDTISFIINIK